uniref:Glycosyltransferase 2-like domain-containing protein n=1 Tax=viral metagenome TaxID=1070528 RepID=A0A6C0I2K9_9ZZZZ
MNFIIPNSLKKNINAVTTANKLVNVDASVPNMQPSPPKVIEKTTQKTTNATTANATPTLCFISMCKNEEHCIKQTLESVYKYIDYWVVCDTGSTDKTCDIVKSFFKEKNIPGELFIDEWIGFDKNKTLMFERAYKKTDYVLYLDADDFLVGDFKKELISGAESDKFDFKTKRGNSQFTTSYLYNNSLQWVYAGVAHNIIVCLNKNDIVSSNIFVNQDGLYIDANEKRGGSRKLDPNKYLNDALKLKDQFFETLHEDPYGLNSRSVFYTAQSYYDSKMFKEAYQWYNLYTKLKDTWLEEEFESQMRMGHCMIQLKYNVDNVINQFEKAIQIFPDRAEPYYALGKFLNVEPHNELAYKYLKEAKTKNVEEVLKKYRLFVDVFVYGKYVNDELSVACYWTNRGNEGFKLLNEVINDDDCYFTEHKERFEMNKQHFMNKYRMLHL